MRRTTILALLTEASEASSSRQPPTASQAQLDTSFGGDGKVTTDITAGGDFAAEVAIQADGKIVVVGGAQLGQKPEVRAPPIQR